MKWKDKGPNPVLTALLAGAGATGLSYAAMNPILETVRSLKRPFTDNPYGNPLEGKEWDETIDEMKKNKKGKLKTSLLVGGGTALLAAGILANPNLENFGLLDWNAGPRINPKNVMNIPKPLQYFKKEASLANNYGSSVGSSFMDQPNWGQQVNLRAANNLFANDPFLAQNDYARHMGMAIVNNAGIMNHTSRPTLGNVFDSAVDKIGNKLSLGGILDIGLKTTVANGAARLFTGALGTMVGLPPSAQKKLVDAGTWAGAIGAIFN